MQKTLRPRHRLWLALALGLGLLWSKPARADGEEGSAHRLPPVDSAPPTAPVGVFYERFEPTFYAGYAPRTLDPDRIHLHVGRGNQLRATVVLSDEVLGGYVRDLLARYRTFRSLIDSGDIRLTQNTAFETLETTARSVSLERRAAEEKSLSPEALRERNLALLERLNPGRVFRIRMPLDEVIGRWAAHAGSVAPGSLDLDAQVDLLNAMLPTRLFLERKDVDAQTTTELKALVTRVQAESGAPRVQAAAALRPGFLQVLDRVTKGRYPARGNALEFVEFTALYPVGTANEFTTHKGKEIPLYAGPGRRRLTTHQRSNTIDHIAEVPTYSYSPWLPYMHVGPKMHNAFHTPYWELRFEQADFLPDALRTTTARTRDGGDYSFVYLLSRGPASHGCTHVNPGHLVELRQLLPSETDRLDEVEVFINKSHLFDVFDIDGDLAPEVMGVRYFVAYSIRDDKPGKMRTPNQRKPFYDWLYGGAIRFEPDGAGVFEDIQDGRFVGDAVVDGTRYDRLPLYEAAHEPERIQFYGSRPIPFVRELRKVGENHPFSARSAKTDKAL